MPGAPLSIFISYSRSDSEFVDRLEADLRTRDFYVWVDRRKIEVGQRFREEIQKGIDRCQIMLVVLSPEAMASKYVQQEYEYADAQDKPIIPLNWRTTKVPPTLNGIHWANFQSGYDQGLNELLIALSRLVLAALPPARTGSLSASPIIGGPEPALVPPQPAPPPPNLALNELYQKGVEAKANHNLELAVVFWQQVLDRDSSFGNGTLVLQMQRLLAELHPLRVQSLRQQAEQARSFGAWGQEIGAWQALLGMEPDNVQAKARLPIAEHNQKYALYYENALEFAKVNNLAALREQLHLLWRDAPYYGDPAGLAQRVGLRAPVSLQKSMAAQERKVFVSSSNRLGCSLPLVWFCAFCLEGGIGASVGMLSQSWPWALTTVAVLGVLSYLSGYRRVLRRTEAASIFVISSALVLGLTMFLSSYQYNLSHTTHDPVWGDSTIALWSLIAASVVIGAIAGFLEGMVAVAMAAGTFLKRFRQAMLVWIFLAILVIGVGFTGAFVSDGSGLGYTWIVPILVGAIVTFLGGLGVFPSLYLFGKALIPERIDPLLDEMTRLGVQKKGGGKEDDLTIY
jgi:hypothetical protein